MRWADRGWRGELRGLEGHPPEWGRTCVSGLRITTVSVCSPRGFLFPSPVSLVSLGAFALQSPRQPCLLSGSRSAGLRGSLRSGFPPIPGLCPRAGSAAGPWVLLVVPGSQIVTTSDRYGALLTRPGCAAGASESVAAPNPHVTECSRVAPTHVGGEGTHRVGSHLPAAQPGRGRAPVPALEPLAGSPPEPAGLREGLLDCRAQTKPGLVWFSVEGRSKKKTHPLGPGGS